MDAARCPRCGRPYTAGEVTGWGILRPRPHAQGGPVVDFRCPACRFVQTLIPYGQARYAPPGAPPPPAPPESERRLPWQPVAAPGAPAPDRRAPPPPAPPQPTEPPPTGNAPAGVPGERPLDPAQARDLLGLVGPAGPDEVEDAFRERALLCHPDKVAHLDPEFVSLAEAKFRRLQAARDLLLATDAAPGDAPGQGPP